MGSVAWGPWARSRMRASIVYLSDALRSGVASLKAFVWKVSLLLVATNEGAMFHYVVGNVNLHACTLYDSVRGIWG